MITRRKFLRDTTKAGLFLPVASIVRAQEVLPFRRKGGNHLLINLISYWKFDTNEGGTYNDDFGSNNLTQTSTSTGVVGGIIGAGMDLSNGGSHADHAANTDFNPPANTSWAFSLWTKMTDWTSNGNFMAIAINGDGGGNPSWQFSKQPVGQSNKAAFSLWDSGSNVVSIFFAGSAPTGGTFHHLVASFDSPTKTVTAYYDGALAGTTSTVTNSILTTTVAFRFGVGAVNGSSTGFVVDEAAMWHKSLTATDVSNLYRAGAALPLSAFTS